MNQSLAFNSPLAEPASLAAKLAVALAISVAFWTIGNKLDESRALQEQMEIGFDRAENQYAVQQKDTTTSSAIGYFLLGGTGVVCWLAARPGQLRIGGPLILFAAAYLGWCGLSLMWSEDSMQTVRKLAILGLMIIAAVGMAAKFDLEDFIEIIVIVLAGYAALGLLAEAAYGQLRPWRGIYRFGGTMHPNDQGLNCAALALAAWMAPARRTFSPLALRLITVGGLAGLWLSKSRTTLAALVVAFMVYLCLRARGTQRLLVVSACLTFAGAFGIVYSFLSASDVHQATSIAEMGRSEDVSSLTGRLPLWQELWKDAVKNPWVGVGFGAFWGPKNILKYSDMNGWHIPHAHNAYLDLILATGVVGLVLHTAWMLATGVVAGVRYEQSGRLAHLFALCLAVLGLAHGAAESKVPSSGMVGFFVLAVLMLEAMQVSSCEKSAAAEMLTASQRRVLRNAPRRRAYGNMPKLGDLGA